MVKEKGNEKGKGAGKENAKAKAKEKSVNYLIDVVKPMIYTGKVFYSGRVGKYCESCKQFF